jgi:FkbM family methyltransferase
MDLRSLAKTYLPAPVTDALKAARYTLDVWTYPKKIVWHRYGLHPLRMHIQDRVAQEWYDKDWDLPPEIAFLSRHGLKPGALVFDLGAHQCLIAMLLGKHVGPNGLVIAVEANAHNARVAELNLELNEMSNVRLQHALVSSRTGSERASLSFNASRNESAIASDVVRALTIDEMARRFGMPDVVFMDIEGFEIEALKGASATLRQHCTWFIELHGDDTLANYGASNRDVLSYFPPDVFQAHLWREEGDGFAPLRGEPPVRRCFLVFVPRRRDEIQ